jgi:ABC-type sugar transport system ATPase subunit
VVETVVAAGTSSVGVRGVSHSYAGVPALQDVDFELVGGQVHGLIGQNGAGKSTLVRVLGGAVRPQSGRFFVDGERVDVASPVDARRLGIAAVHQDVQLYPDLDVAANVYAVDQRLPRRRGTGAVDWSTVRERTSAFLGELGIDIDPSRRAGALTIAERKLVQIARAVALEARVLILDEPTASLERRASRSVLELMGRLREAGLAICFVSHRLDEVRDVSDAITVIRDGRVVSRLEGRAPEEELIRQMLGRQATTVEPSPAADRGGPALTVRGLSLSGGREPISFEVAAGEIVGLTGVMGAGAEDVARMLAGIRPAAGDVLVHGRPIRLRKPADALRAGIAFIPEDRQREGIFAALSVLQNIPISRLEAVSTAGFLRPRRMRTLATEYVDKMQVRTESLATPAASLSGGNQQKLLVARALAAGAKVLVLHEPTHGVDVGAIAQIHNLLRDFSAQGGAIVIASGEIRELVKLCDRILVFRDRELVDALSPERHDVSDVMLAGVRDVALLDSLIEGRR